MVYPLLPSAYGLEFLALFSFFLLTSLHSELHYRVAFYCSCSVRQYKTLLLLQDKLSALFRFPQISPSGWMSFFKICAIYTCLYLFGLDLSAFFFFKVMCMWQTVRISHQNSLWVSWVRKAPRLGLRNVFNILTSQNHSAEILWCWFVTKQIKSASTKALTHQTCIFFWFTDWTWLFLQRIQISNCKKSNLFILQIEVDFL